MELTRWWTASDVERSLLALRLQAAAVAAAATVGEHMQWNEKRFQSTAAAVNDTKRSFPPTSAFTICQPRRLCCRYTSGDFDGVNQSIHNSIINGRNISTLQRLRDDYVMAQNAASLSLSTRTLAHNECRQPSSRSQQTFSAELGMSTPIKATSSERISGPSFTAPSDVDRIAGWLGTYLFGEGYQPLQQMRKQPEQIDGGKLASAYRGYLRERYRLLNSAHWKRVEFRNRQTKLDCEVETGAEVVETSSFIVAGHLCVVTTAADGKRLFVCRNCGYSTDRKNNLKRHVIAMHGFQPEVNAATLENRQQRTTSVQHEEDHHLYNKSGNSVAGDVGFACSACDRLFECRSALSKHVTVHSGRKCHQCVSCDYVTSHKSNLQRHLRVHQHPLTAVQPVSPTVDGHTREMELKEQ